MQCPHCSESIEEKALRCPYCRQKVQADKAGLTINVILIVAIILLLAAIAAFFRFVAAVG